MIRRMRSRRRLIQRRNTNNSQGRRNTPFSQLPRYETTNNNTADFDDKQS